MANENAPLNFPTVGPAPGMEPGQITFIGTATVPIRDAGFTMKPVAEN